MFTYAIMCENVFRAESERKWMDAADYYVKAIISIKLF